MSAMLISFLVIVGELISILYKVLHTSSLDLKSMLSTDPEVFFLIK